MKRIILSVLVVGTTTAFLSGCASSYSNIRQVQGNTYLVTRNRQGFLSWNADLLRCEAAGDTMNCTQIATP